MFEVGFTELLLIFGLALIVLGPEKLPRVAAQVGRWIGRAKSMARQFREQLEDEAIIVDEPSGSKKKRAAAATTGAGTTGAADAAAADAVAEPTTAEPADAPTEPQAKYYQPDDDTQRSDVSHSDAGAEPATTGPTTGEPPSHERGA